MKPALRRATPLRAAFPMGAALDLGTCALTASMPGAPLRAAHGGVLQQCETLVALFSHEQTLPKPGTVQAAGALKLGGRDVAEHCVVTGAMNARKGSVGRASAIGFEMRLPRDWNGRLFYQGNGGLDGNVRPAEGGRARPGLRRLPDRGTRRPPAQRRAGTDLGCPAGGSSPARPSAIR